MKVFSPMRVMLVALLCGGALGQVALPPMPPTTRAVGTAGPVAGGAVASGAGAHKAEVEYTGGLLQVSANNSSLNQILREIGRLTGMKITGGVADDRVFGTYGPAPASKVITSLLDGTAANVMIVENSAAGPAELILTTRQGGPTPPNPNAGGGEVDDAVNRQQGPPRGEVVPPRGGDAFRRPPGQDNGQAPAMVNTDNPPPPAASTPVSGDGGQQPTSPNGVSTPQQIYEQLQRMRQQQQDATPK